MAEWLRASFSEVVDLVWTKRKKLKGFLLDTQFVRIVGRSNWYVYLYGRKEGPSRGFSNLVWQVGGRWELNSKTERSHRYFQAKATQQIWLDPLINYLEKSRDSRRSSFVSMHSCHHSTSFNVGTASVVSDTFTHEKDGVSDRAFPFVQQLYDASLVTGNSWGKVVRLSP